MKSYLPFLCFLFLFLNILIAQKPPTKAVCSYFPPIHTWEEKQPSDLGLDNNKIQQAIEFHKTHEVKNTRSMEQSHYQSFGKEPFGDAIGPFTDRGEPTGLIIYKGYIIAKWGEPNRCDMTHSVTKSFLSTVVGLASDNTLINNVHDPVHTYMPPIELYNQPLVKPAESFGKPEMISPFDTPHNRKITWDHLLRQTSDFEGTFWGKPDWADRPDKETAKWLNREREAPGTVYEYNDVRVNALALAALSVWRKPLPEVLKEKIMDPIGASNTWRWTGYRNSWIVLDGKAVQSVSGGGHWGGGMIFNAFDMARFGLLTLHKGNWNGKQLISKQWIDQSQKPTGCKPTNGYINYFLNTNKELLPSAPASSYYHVGNGTNMIYVDTEHDLVMVVRWLDNNSMDGMVKSVLEAFTK